MCSRHITNAAERDYRPSIQTCPQLQLCCETEYIYYQWYVQNVLNLKLNHTMENTLNINQNVNFSVTM